MKEKHMTRNPTGPKRILTPIPLTQNPPPGSTGFGPGLRAPSSLSVEFGPKVPQCRPQAAQATAPTSLISAFHWIPKPIPEKKEVSGPEGAAETRSSPAPDTCEARHLRANRGPPGLPRAHPLGARCFAAARTSVPARPASYRRARRLLISMAPAPPPPPAAAAAFAAGGRETTSSGLHRHVRRAANCIVGGGRGGEGEEGEGEKEEDPLKGGGQRRRRRGEGEGKVGWIPEWSPTRRWGRRAKRGRPRRGDAGSRSAPFLGSGAPLDTS